MGEVVDYAVELAEKLTAAGVKATSDVRAAAPPCVLVVPVPRRDYTILGGGYQATWTVVCLANPPGDLNAATALEDLADRVVAAIGPVETVEPGSYQLRPDADPYPSYQLTFPTTVC